MRDSLEAEDPSPEISTATGDFYHAYKRELSSFIESTKSVARDALGSGVLRPADAMAIERGMQNLEGSDLLRLLSKIIDEKEPSFFSECAVSSITNMLGSIFVIAKHAGFTESAHALALQSQAKVARAGAEPARQKRRVEQDGLVRKHAASVGVDLSNPYITAKAIVDLVNEDLKAANRKTVDQRTVQRWVGRLGSI